MAFSLSNSGDAGGLDLAPYAGARLLAVADGMGGHAAGELLNALDHAARRADSALRDMVRANPALDGMAPR
jgi:serine/threonine protein phosphatase PrpC